MYVRCHKEHYAVLQACRDLVSFNERKQIYKCYIFSLVDVMVLSRCRLFSQSGGTRSLVVQEHNLVISLGHIAMHQTTTKSKRTKKNITNKCKITNKPLRSTELALLALPYFAFLFAQAAFVRETVFQTNTINPNRISYNVQRLRLRTIQWRQQTNAPEPTR